MKRLLIFVLVVMSMACNKQKNDEQNSVVWYPLAYHLYDSSMVFSSNGQTNVYHYPIDSTISMKFDSLNKMFVYDMDTFKQNATYNNLYINANGPMPILLDVSNDSISIFMYQYGVGYQTRQFFNGTKQ